MTRAELRPKAFDEWRATAKARTEFGRRVTAVAHDLERHEQWSESAKQKWLALERQADEWRRFIGAAEDLLGVQARRDALWREVDELTKRRRELQQQVAA